MKNNYKIIINERRLCKEVLLCSEEKEIVKIGTSQQCDIRFRKEMYLEEFEFELFFQDGTWNIKNNYNVFFAVDELVKTDRKQLNHGDEWIVKTSESYIELFQIQFMIDFDANIKNYEKRTYIESKDVIVIGTDKNSNLVLKSDMLKHGNLELIRQMANGSWKISPKNTEFGIYVNGKLLKQETMLENYSFISLADFSFYFANGFIYFENSSRIFVQRVEYEEVVQSRSYLEYPYFTRNTRIIYDLPKEDYNLLLPDQKPKLPKEDMIQRLMPMLVTMGMMASMQSFMGRGNMMIYSIGMYAATLVTTVMSAAHIKKDYQLDLAEREKEYRRYLEDKEQTLKQEQEKEIGILQRKYLALEECVRLALEFDKRLFEKEKIHEDYLSICLGKGKRVSGYDVHVDKAEKKIFDDELQDWPSEIVNQYKYLEDAPIVMNLKEFDAIGIVGEKEWLWEFGKNITIDIAARHYYHNVKMFFMFENDEYKHFQWIRWLKHVRLQGAAARGIVCDDNSRKFLYEYLYEQLAERKEEKEFADAGETLVIFVFDMKHFLDHPVSKFVKNSAQLGIHFIFFALHEEFLPYGCGEVIRLTDSNHGKRIVSEHGQQVDTFSYPHIDNKLAEAFARCISPIVIKEVNLDSQLTKSITMFELLNIYSENEINFQENWSKSKVYESMAAPIGVKTGNEIVYLDLHEKYHGPHGLVAGTTGSGKSEVLQTYILSMATLFHPYEVGFVLIDFKGGGMLNQFKKLPHLIGTITNIDGREIERSLKSIKAELRKRQEVFAEYNVNHIDQYIKLFKDGKAGIPLPHIILIVDEFAELKAEFPDFMDELISAARIGRSLGMHLILATQKPSGVVNDQIWSNSKFKICLKVQDKSDSREMIKVDLAAEIREPGRGYLQVGNNEIFELFQSAYSGAPAFVEEEEKKEFEIFAVDIAGRKRLIYDNKQKKQEKDSQNQLDVIVDAIDRYCKSVKMKYVDNICMKPLEEVIYLSALSYEKVESEEGIFAHIGIYDDPEQQVQDVVKVNMTASNVLIAGSAQMGKTTILQTILYSLIKDYTPEEINIYIADFGTMALKVFEKSKMVGGVVLPSEEQKMANLIKLFREQIEKRKEIFLEKGIGTYRAYREAGYDELPILFLVIDNYMAFKEYYENDADEILVFSRDGQSVGIYLIITDSSGNALGYKMASNFATKFSLYQTESGTYSNLFDHCKLEPKNVPGRGIMELDKRILEFQTALCVEAEKEFIRNGKISEFMEERNKIWKKEWNAQMIPDVPKVLTKEIFDKYCAGVELDSWEIPIGLDFNEIQIRSIDFRKNMIFSIMGKEKSGKSNLLQYVVQTILENNPKETMNIIVFDNYGGDLKEWNEQGMFQEYYTEVAPIKSVIMKLESRLEDVKDAYLEDPNTLKEKRRDLLIINNWDVMDIVNQNPATLSQFTDIIDEYERFKVNIIFGCFENIEIGFSQDRLYRNIRNTMVTAIFENLAYVKTFEFSSRDARENKRGLAVGDAFLRSKEGEILRIKTVLNQ